MSDPVSRIKTLQRGQSDIDNSDRDWMENIGCGCTTVATRHTVISSVSKCIILDS